MQMMGEKVTRGFLSLPRFCTSSHLQLPYRFFWEICHLFASSAHYSAEFWKTAEKQSANCRPRADFAAPLPLCFEFSRETSRRSLEIRAQLKGRLAG